MATSVNIGGGDDQFNRYKMPVVVAKVEGRGNGIKTRIVNCFEVARALHRPPGYVCKFFGCELGAQTKIDDNAGVYIVNGAFQQTVLTETLRKFIDMFVLCTNCNLPETDLKLKKNGNITQACNACGTEALCDMTHKLCTYIANNPPDGKKKKADRKKDKATRRALKAKKANGDLAAVDDDDEKARRKADRAAKKAAKKAAESGESLGMTADIDFDDDFIAAGPADDDDDDDVQWSVDTSKEAQEARMRELGAAASILERAPAEDDHDLATKLRTYIDDGKKPSKVLSKSGKLFGQDDVIQGLMMAAVVDETLATMAASVEERAIPVLQSLGEPMPVSAQSAFLDYLDWAGGHDEKMMAVLPHFLKAVYDEDLVEEEHIFNWYRKEDGRQDVRDSVKVFIKWLEEADEEDSGEEEESEEEE